MEKTVQELKMIIRELILEVGDLKERVTYLEQERQVDDQEEIRQPLADSLDSLYMQGEGYENLGRIYGEGYHVCPAAYGQRRNGECLFCIAFMEKE